jgi:transposase
MKALRKKGFQKHGKLKFIKELRVINLKQYGVTHEIRSSTKMKIQGVSKLVKVAGIQQLKHLKHVDFANAKLLNTASGYYIALTCYLPISKKKHSKSNKSSKTDQNTIGIDFGCQTSLTLSDGKKINISFGEGE